MTLTEAKKIPFDIKFPQPDFVSMVLVFVAGLIGFFFVAQANKNNPASALRDQKFFVDEIGSVMMNLGGAILVFLVSCFLTLTWGWIIGCVLGSTAFYWFAYLLIRQPLKQKP